MRNRWAASRWKGPIAVAALVVSYGLSCHRAPLPSAEEQVLERQITAIEALLSASASGSILPFEQILVVVDQSLVQDIISAVLPLEGDVGGFHLRIEGAEAAFGDGVALLRLRGRVNSAGKNASASMVVYGGIDAAELSPQSGLLRGRVSVYGVEVQKADVLGVDERGLTRALAHAGLETLLPFVEVPIRFQDTIAIPAVRSERLQIRAAQMPLNAKVALLRAFGGKLCVVVEAHAGEQSARSTDVKSAP